MFRKVSGIVGREYLRLRQPFHIRLFKFLKLLGRGFALMIPFVIVSVMLLWFFNNDAQLISRAYTATVQMTEQTNSDVLELAPTESHIKANNVKFGTATEIPSLGNLYKTRKSSEAKKIIRRGTIAIPELGVKSAIYEGTNKDSLVWGAGTAKANQQMGQKNYAVSAHNYKQVKGASEWFFSNIQTKLLPKVKGKESHHQEQLEKYIAVPVGTKIYTTDMKFVYVYEVLYREIVDVKANYVLSDKRVDVFSVDETPIITLTTCLEQVDVKNPNERIVLVGKLLGKKKWSKVYQASYF